MPARLNRLRRITLQSFGVLALLVLFQSASAMSVSPSTSYTGSYTVYWGWLTGCEEVGGYPYYPVECYYLQQRFNGGAWTTISASGVSKPFSGKPQGTYQYRVYYEYYLMGGLWDAYVVEGPVQVNVVAPAAPGTPSGPTTTEYDGAYTISWGSVTGATAYRLQERLNGGSWSTLQASSATSRPISGKTPGTWDYQVRAESSVGNSAWSGIKSVTVSAPATPGTPTGPSTDYDGAYTISWGAVTGASTYRLEEQISGGSWATIQNTSSTSKAVSGKTAGTWQYRVRAESGAGSSGYSGTKSVNVSAPAAPGTPSGPTGTEYDGAYTISWSAVTGATSYRLEERISGGSWSMIQNTSSTSKAVSGKTPGTWEYRVSAENSVGSSSYSSTKFVAVAAPAAPGTPSGPMGTEYDGAYTISWGAVTGAASYRLEERISSGSWSMIQNTSSTSKAVTDKTPGTWEYRVRAEAGAGNSAYSATKSVAVAAPATPGTPSGPSSSYGGSYTISWSEPTGATSYTLQERVNGGSWSTIHDAAGAGKNVTATTEGSYNYQVRACSDAGCSSYSAIATVFVVLPPSTSGATPGAISGGFSVGTQGDANYTIPISVPAGTGGLKPSLALSYNHLTGNGLAGMRWTLSGISAITRCPRTFAQDGGSSSANDRYCLNGQRLIDFDGIYHADGTVYRTEIESFQRIVQDGPTLEEERSFYVDHGNGLRSYYGDTADSLVVGPGGFGRTWYISRTVDLFGNTIEYDYYSPTADETLPETITWTGNSTTSPALSPHYAVTITYENRPTDDQRSGYDSLGAAWSRTKRIDEIDVTYDDGQTQTIATYALTYASTAPPNGTGRSQLTEVSVCRGSECLPETLFTVQDGTSGWYNAVTTSRSIGSYPLAGDWNGDGRMDLFVSLGNEWQVYPGKADGLFDTTVDTNISSTTNPGQARVFDFDGDGLADLLYQNGSSSWQVALSNGGTTTSGFASATSTGVLTSTVPNPILQDHDGDGLTDLIYATTSNLRWRRNQGGSFASASTLYTAEVSVPSFSVGTVDSGIRSLDANGDGRADLIVEVEDCVFNPSDPEEYYCENDYYLLLAQGGVYTSILFSTTPEGSYNTNFRVGDFNGDGLDDFMYLNPAGTSWIMQISTGDDVDGSPSSAPVTNAEKVLIADYDGDGRDDLIRPDGNYWRIHRSNGTTLPASYTDSVYSQSVTTASAFVADIAGSGFPQIVRTQASSWYVHKAKRELADVVTDFTDGLGRTVSVEYASLAQTASYTLDLNHNPSESYVRRYGGARYVVTAETHDDGIGGTRDVLHGYDTAFVNTAGRGWQSFRGHTVTDVAQGTYTATQYSQSFPTAGAPVLVEQRTVSGSKLIRSVVSTLPTPAQMVLSGSSTPPRQFPRVEQTTTVEKEVFGPNDGATLRTIVEDPEYDTMYGYVTDITRTVTQPGVSGAWVSETDFDRGVIDDTGVDQWCLGLPGLVQTTSSLPGGSPSVRKVEYLFNSDCRLDTVTDLSDTLTSKQLETSYAYDQYGNVNTVSEHSVAAPSAARTTSIGYDSTGQFSTSVTTDSAGLNLTTSLAWDFLLGLQTSITGPDGLTTSFQYDAFGRLTKETRPAGYTDVTYLECSVCFPQHAAYFVHAEDSGGGEQYTFFDHLGRAVGSDTALRGGARSREEARYLATGQADKTSLPYVAGESVFWVSYDYDGIGRLIEEDAPVSETQGSGALTEYEYLGHTLKVTDPENHATQYVHNALGQIEQVIDALGGDTFYSYHPFGELHQVTDDASNPTTILYDPRGFKSDLYDPDMGHWTYEHNAFGELIWQQDAKGQEVDLYYDAAGRLDSRVEAEGTTDWSYYTSGAGLKGRLEEVTGPGGLAEEYVYAGTSGLLTQVTRTIGSASYTFDYAFDSHGRLIEMTYPQNVHSTRFGVEYAYDGWGALAQVYDAATPSLVYYTADSQDALGRARQATLGNGLVEKLDYSQATGRLVSIETGPAQTATLQDLAYDWDLAGNLVERFDDVLDQTDVFTYDALNRLEEVERDASATLTMTYDALGNVVTKSDLTGSYAYGAGTAGPHAVTSIGSMTFSYDLNGSMTSRNGATIGWTSYNLPDHITHTSGDYADFTYGPDRSRWIQEAEEGTWEYMRHYAGTGFEVLTWGTSSRVDTHYIFANSQAVAQWTTSNVESDLLQYLHRDHQGSVVATTNDQGSLIAEYEYDAFGKRTVLSGSGEDTLRGYTGHEHLAPVEMIHMNGRVQDPVLGRFLSADPFVQAPYYSQSLNRYSYVWNNPLSLADPSGFQAECNLDGYGCPDPDQMACDFWSVCMSLERHRQLEEWDRRTQYLASLGGTGVSGVTSSAPPDVLDEMKSAGVAGPQGAVPNSIAAAGNAALIGAQDYFAERCNVPVACGVGYAASTAVYEGFIEDALIGVDEFRARNYGGAGAAAFFAVFKPAKLGKKIDELLPNGSAGGSRAGKPFTPRGKAEIDAANAERNGGLNVCESCGTEVVPGQRSQRGVTPPGNERQRDHIFPRSKGGDGEPSNGQVLCRACNLEKSDNL